MSSDVQCCRDIYWTRPGPKLLCSLCQHQQNHNAFGLPVRTTGCTSIWSAATVSSYLLTWMTRGWCEGIILRVSLSCKQGGKSTQVNLYLQKSTLNTGIFNFCKDSFKCVCIKSYRGMVAAWKQLETAAKTETGLRNSVLKLGRFSAVFVATQQKKYVFLSLTTWFWCLKLTEQRARSCHIIILETELKKR